MKRLLLLFSLFISITSWADSSSRVKSYTFHFNNPESLNPSLARPEGEGGTVSITDKIFTSDDGLISMSFFKPEDKVIGVELVTDNSAHDMIPFLKMARDNEMTLTATGATITQFKISAADVISALNKKISIPETPGILNLSSDYAWYRWPVDEVNNTLLTDQSFSSVTFYNTAVKATEIHEIYVEYELPRNSLTPTSVSLTEGAELKSFTSITLTFSENMSAATGGSYYLKDANNNNYPLAATFNGNNVTLTAEGGPITILGDYTLTVSGGSFKDASDTFCNSEVVRHFTIIENKATFNYVEVSPAAGDVTSISSGILLTFSGIVGKVDDTMSFKITNADGSTVKTCSIANVTDTSIDNYSKKVIITFSNLADITETGVYTLTIPEGIVYDADNDCYNPEIVVSYNIGHVASAELQTKAEELLALTGVGYPSSTSAERTALAALLGIGTTAEFNAAIDAYYASTDIEKPVTGNYYRVAAQNNVGTLIYLSYTDGAITLTNDVSQAAAFKATANGDGTVTLATLDGKYLHNLVSADVYTGTSTTQLTDTYTAALNNLTLSHLNITSLTPEQSFGLLSLYGSLGTNAAGTTMNAYALVDVSTQTVKTDFSLGLDHYTATLTNAFRLTEISKSALPVPNAAYTLIPTNGTSVDILKKVTITFPGISDVTMADLSKIYAQRNGTTIKYPAKSVVAVSGTTNSFDVTFDELPAGEFKVLFEKGSFTYTFEETYATVQAITASYSIRTGIDFIADLLNSSATTIYDKHNWTSYVPVKDTDLNDFTLWSDDTELWPDPSVQVVLTNFNTMETIATGKFQQYDDPDLPNNKNHKGCIRLVFDDGKRITSGELETGTYIFVIPTATFGDANFGKYLAGTTGVVKNDCHVNDYLPFVVLVDNATAGKVYPSKEVLNQAKELLKDSGLGYPAANSEARMNLQKLVNVGEGADAVFQTAMTAFYNETNVEKPAAGNYYRIEAVASDGKRAYLQYNGYNVSVTRDVVQATGFYTTQNNDGTFSFMTGDGKYLRQIMADADNVNETFDKAINNLTVGKLVVTGVAPKDTYGKFSLSGTVGKDNKLAYTLVNVANATIHTDASKALTSYTTTLTNAIWFTKVEKTDIPVPEPSYSISPQDGTEYDVLDKVTVTFAYPKQPTIADKQKIYVTTPTDQKVIATNVTAVQGQPGTFEVTFHETEPGNYHFVIAEGAFTYTFAEITHSIGGKTVDFKVKVPRPSEEVLTKAKDLLKMSGVGYPRTFSTARQLLQKLVTNGTGTNEVFNKAIADYYAETDVELPVTDNYYRVEAMTPKGEKAYLSYNGKSIGVTSKEAEATAFRVQLNNTDGSLTFKTADGKYLQQVVANADNLNAEYDKTLNNLKLDKLIINGVNNEQTLGLFSLKGAVGSDKQQAYLLMNVAQPAILTDATKGLTSFTETLTNAVQLTKVDKTVIPIPTVAYMLSPVSGTELDELDKLTISFSYPNRVSTSSKEKIYLTDKDGKKIVPAYVTQPVGQYNIEEMKFSDIVPGTYTLTIEKGAFTYMFAETSHEIEAVTATYTVKTPRPSDDVLDEAQNALSQSGIGYPAEDSKARLALEILVEKGIGSDDIFTKAIADYYAETDVQKPESGVYYRLEAVSSKGAKAYLTYDGKSIGVTGDKSEATAFRAQLNLDGSYAFITADGKYLQQVIPGGDNLTTAYDLSVNNLQLDKLIIDGISNEQTLGLFSLKGVVGSNKQQAYLLIDVAQPAIMTDATKGLTSFTETLTNAVTVTEVNKSVIPVPTTEYTLSPVSGTELDELDKLTINFSYPNKVNIGSKDKIYLTGKDGKKIVPAYVTQPVGQYDTEEIHFTDVVPGTYTLTIEKGAFTYMFAEIGYEIETITATYTVKTPRPSDDVMADAVLALSKTGVGYPRDNSAARLALLELVTTGEGTDEMFQAAIRAFWAETDIELPATGKYYRVIAVSKNGAKVYLKYDGNTISLTKKASEATAVKATANADGTINFQTVDGKYLHQLVNNSIYDGTSEANVLDEYDATLNDLIVGRLQIQALDEEETFGLFSIYGSVGQSDGEAQYAYTLIDVSTPAILTFPALGLSYTDRLTSAFLFEETDPEDINVPEPAFELSLESGSTMDYLTEVTLEFTSYGKVELADEKQIYLKDAKGELIYLHVAETSDNVYTLSFEDVDKGTYTLTIEDGAFTFTFLDVATAVKGFTADYTVTIGTAIRTIRVDEVNGEPVY